MPCRQLQQLEEQKKQLEHYNATIQEEKDTLLLQNNSLTERLEAVTNEKLPSHQFDGQTPIDKTLDLLQSLIMVCRLLLNFLLANEHGLLAAILCNTLFPYLHRYSSMSAVVYPLHLH